MISYRGSFNPSVLGIGHEIRIKKLTRKKLMSHHFDGRLQVVAPFIPPFCAFRWRLLETIMAYSKRILC